jgi:hypothetical protein
MSTAGPSVLFLPPDGPDYLSDGLFHGLRHVLGSGVLDWPRRDVMYRDCPEEYLFDLHGHGFTLYRRLEPMTFDRALVIDRLREGEFKLVVFGSIQRQYGLWLQLRTHLPLDGTTSVAFLDGEDWPGIYPYTLERANRPRWRWALPRAHKRYPYFKRELMSIWGWRHNSRLPASLVRRLPLGDVRPISFSIPEEEIVETVSEKATQFPGHVVDPEVASHLPATNTSMVFEYESDYYTDLRASRFGITTKRSGWDCMRHYEIAASGTVICFRDLQRKPASCAPHGLDERNTIAYTSYEELVGKLERLSPGEEHELAERALEWARANTTRRRAFEFLDSVGFADR